MLRSHLERLPEFYEQKYKQEFEDLDWNWIKTLLSKKRILVIDDEASIRNAYSRTFTNNGFDVFTASNATDANDILVKERIDLILLDINMPEVDGTVFIELIRLFHRDSKVVISSVYSVDEQREKVRDADGYFDKSDGIDVLMGSVSSILNMGQNDQGGDL